jgi:hypothetical protein
MRCPPKSSLREAVADTRGPGDIIPTLHRGQHKGGRSEGCCRTVSRPRRAVLMGAKGYDGTAAGTAGKSRRNSETAPVCYGYSGIPPLGTIPSTHKVRAFDSRTHAT